MIRTAVESDIARIAEDLRESDVKEVYSSHRHTPLEAVTFSFTASQLALTYVFKGRPVAMFGLVPTGAVEASIWLLATNGLHDTWRTFLKLSREFIGWFLELYPFLYNYVDADNNTTIHWLEWCGAKFGEAEPYGQIGNYFRRFVIERSSYV